MEYAKLGVEKPDMGAVKDIDRRVKVWRNAYPVVEPPGISQQEAARAEAKRKKKAEKRKQAQGAEMAALLGSGGREPPHAAAAPSSAGPSSAGPSEKTPLPFEPSPMVENVSDVKRRRSENWCVRWQGGHQADCGVSLCTSNCPSFWDLRKQLGMPFMREL